MIKKGYRFWRGSGVAFNTETKLFERVEFELELAYPVKDPYKLEVFLRFLCKEFIYKGKKIIVETIRIPEKESHKLIFKVKV